MEYKEYKWDRNRPSPGWTPPREWPEGKWDYEPDKVQFQDEATGLPCLIVRNGSGALCGYVGVLPDHPLHGDDYDYALDINVHGGITFAGPCMKGKDAESNGICHIPGPGESDNVWWFGFDCSHCDDASPSDYVRRGGDESFGEKMDKLSPRRQYRDIEYVRGEIRQLAQQLHDYKPGPTEIEA